MYKLDTFIQLIKNNRIVWRRDLPICVATAAIAILMTIFFHPFPENTIGKVNITGLVNQFVQTLVQRDESEALRKQHITEYGHRLEQVLKEISKKEHIVLLPSEAVIAGTMDYTPQVEKAMSQLKQEDQSE